jgi:acyl carrier protein
VSHEFIEDIYPLSPMQRGMLLHSITAPGSGMYHEQSVWRISGEVDAGALRRAWQRVIDRHPALRSGFIVEDLDAPLQIVERQVALPWHEEDWRGVPAQEVPGRIEALLAADRVRGFELGLPPLLRLSLIRAQARALYLVTSNHHLLMDGWCLPLILDEVLRFYAAFAAGGELTLPSPRPYRDYIEWLQAQGTSRAEAFWRKELAGFERPTRLRGAGARTLGMGPGAHAEQLRSLSPATTQALEALAREHRLSLSTVVQGAWALVVSQLSGARDVVFGAVVTGRPPQLPGVESMIGLFINTLPVRVQVSPELALLPWLQRLQERHAEARAFEYLSLADVQRCASTPPGVPLFDSVIVFQRPSSVAAGPRSGEAAPLTLEPVRFVSARTSIPLTLLIMPGERLAVLMVTDTGVLDEAASAQVLESLLALLEAMAANPSRPLGALLELVKAPAQAASPEPTTAPAAAGELEQALARIFARVLGRERVEPASNFFALGGDSFAAAQLLLEARSVLGVELSLETFTEAPTVRGMVLASLALRSAGEQELLDELEHMSDQEAEQLLRAAED